MSRVSGFTNWRRFQASKSCLENSLAVRICHKQIQFMHAKQHMRALAGVSQMRTLNIPRVFYSIVQREARCLFSYWSWSMQDYLINIERCYWSPKTGTATLWLVSCPEEPTKKFCDLGTSNGAVTAPLLGSQIHLCKIIKALHRTTNKEAIYLHNSSAWGKLHCLHYSHCAISPLKAFTSCTWISNQKTVKLLSAHTFCPLHQSCLLCSTWPLITMTTRQSQIGRIARSYIACISVAFLT